MWPIRLRSDYGKLDNKKYSHISSKQNIDIVSFFPITLDPIISSLDEIYCTLKLGYLQNRSQILIPQRYLYSISN